MLLHNKNNTKQFNTTHTGLSAELAMIQTATLGQHSCAGAAVPPRRGKTMFRVAGQEVVKQRVGGYDLKTGGCGLVLRCGQEHFQQKAFNEVETRAGLGLHFCW